MKIKSFFILSIILYLNIFSQSADTLFLNSEIIDTSNYIEVNGWKFHSGDDSLWAKLTYNDSEWDTIQASIPTKNAVFDDWKGIGWFRKIIKIDSSLFNKQSALLMWHLGASQIYLNGKLIKEFGKVSDNVSDEKNYQPRFIPIGLIWGNDTINLLAIRYSNFYAANDKNWYKKWFNSAGFKMMIANLNASVLSSIKNEELAFLINIGISAIFLSLSFLYFILFFFYSMKKENLYYSLFTFFISLSFLSQMLARFNHSNFQFFIIIEILKLMGIIFIFISYLAFLYSIFYKKFPKQFWIFLLLSFINPILTFYLTDQYENLVIYLLLIYIFLTTVEGLRVIIVAIKNKRENARIIGIGVLIFVILVITLFVLGLTGNGNINSLWGIVLFFFGLISLPISMSVYLARNIASTNKKLEEQLITVKELSQREIENQRRTAELEIKAERERIENERKTKELEDARELQLSLLPKELPKLTEYDIAVFMKTATEVGGDYYDFHIDEDKTLTVAIGDATGHGLMAGTMVTATKSLFNSFAGNPDILSTLSLMANSLRGMNFKLLSMCFSIAKIKNKKLIISSAGMPPILIYRRDRNYVEEIFIRGMPLGSAILYDYELKETNLNKGDIVLLYSDGFPELFNKDKKMFGYDRLKKELLKITDNDSRTIVKELNKVIEKWIGDNAPDDDITFVVIKVK